MADSEVKHIQARDKAEASPTAESTKGGPTFTPAVDIYETDMEIMLLADMPGVKPKDLSIDLRDNVLTLSSEVEPLEGPDEIETMVEYRTGTYFRQFTLSKVIDQAKIEADLSDGVLRLKLPKVLAATPRKIEIKAG